jgi:hypothetical protein
MLLAEGDHVPAANHGASAHLGVLRRIAPKLKAKEVKFTRSSFVIHNAFIFEMYKNDRFLDRFYDINVIWEIL